MWVRDIPEMWRVRRERMRREKRGASMAEAVKEVVALVEVENGEAKDFAWKL